MPRWFWPLFVSAIMLMAAMGLGWAIGRAVIGSGVR